MLGKLEYTNTSTPAAFAASAMRDAYAASSACTVSRCELVLRKTPQVSAKASARELAEVREV